MELDRRDFLLGAVAIGTLVGAESNVTPASERDIDQWGDACWGAGTWGGVATCVASPTGGSE